MRSRFHRVFFGMVIVSLATATVLSGQTASTGAVTGVTFDPSGSIIPRVLISLSANDSLDTKSSISDANGAFVFPSLPPGAYDLQASKTDFKPLTISNLEVHVTETVRLELHLVISSHEERTQVSSETLMVQVDSSALGRLVNAKALNDLPVVNRNFTEIASLSPGVFAGVYNAGELGIGGTALSQVGKSNDGIYVHGARSYDNNWQLDGISISDVIGSGSASGGIPIPNPDMLQEFKVQTGLSDAAFGRGTGANVSVVTRTGANDFHASIFEFLRNNLLNANDFFLNETHRPRADLKQNQFGVAIGGPIQKDRFFFFGSYQGTRQINGLASGQARIACSATVSEPPLTNDRSAAALGQLFGGMKGALGGIAVAPNGSNINPVALALLNYKLPNGSFLIPTPQIIDPSRPFASQGFSAFSEPCEFNEDQLLFNLDYTASQKSHLSTRFFFSNDAQQVTFPGNSLNVSGNTPGFASPGDSQFFVFSLAHNYVLNSEQLNEARIGYVRTSTNSQAHSPFAWSDVGVSEGAMNENNELPSLSILGSESMAPAFPRTYAQNSLVFSDVFSLVAGDHTLNFGGTLARLQANLDFAGFGSFLEFLSWPDFLLGLNGTANATGKFSNVFESADVFGLLNRELRAWEGSAFVQDNYRVKQSLTFSLGLRYERLGQFADNLGRNSSFDFNRADSSPPPQGSLDGYLVADNFQGPIPPGVNRVNNAFGTYADGQNTIAPRIGFAWQILPTSTDLTLRGGYGIYYSRPPAQVFSESVIAAPFAETRISTGLGNANATFQEPFAQPFPVPASFPLFSPYSPTTNLGINSLAPNFRPAMVQQFSLNAQAELLHDWLLEIGYVGSKGDHLQRFRSLNQALSASPEHPINGQTSNTLANIGLRVPVPGIRPDALREMESEGSSWYNGLEVSLTKRLSHGLQFLASYTFSKTLDTDGSEINGVSAGNTLPLGNQNSPSQRWGPSSIDRPQRFVFSTAWALPSPHDGWQRAFFGAWDLAGVVTVQSGTALTIAYTNADNVFGISEDRAQLSGACTKSQLVTGGPVSTKLNDYFNRTCFTTPPVIGADGVGAAFGDSGTGIVDGPGQANVDLALSKMVPINWPTETGNLQIRAEFFNALNHPQFANPDTNFSSSTFGVISSTSVNPRVIQLALRFSF
jgi:Carboxypeptidase regulatory-like domain/TonB dependent receptor/TonB-dependent Receptor Plug Domain